MDSELLYETQGGRRILREGNAIVRPCYPSSASVQRLLRFLEHVGFPGAPRFLGAAGSVERLSYIEGESGATGWTCALPDSGLLQMARLLRSYHDAVADFRAEPSDRWSSGESDHSPGQVILHGDPGPWNFVWNSEGSPIALIDWDHANPGDPLDDLAYLAAYAAPLISEDEEAMTWMRHPGPPDRAHRLRVLAAGYGASVDGLVDRAIDVIAKTNRTLEHMARQGLEPQRSWADGTKLKRMWARHAWMVSQRDEFSALL